MRGSERERQTERRIHVRALAKERDRRTDVYMYGPREVAAVGPSLVLNPVAVQNRPLLHDKKNV